VNILVCIVVINVIASVGVGTHPWIGMKLPISYEKIFHPSFVINVICNLSFAIRLIFNCKCRL
jgi:hypothetical protein